MTEAMLAIAPERMRLRSPQRTGWLTPLNILLACAAMFALLMIFAMQRGDDARAEASFDKAWADQFQTSVAKKTDVDRQARVILTEPKPVPTERIVPDAPPVTVSTLSPSAPPVVEPDEEGERPAVIRKRKRPIIERPAAEKKVVEKKAESNVCTRHGKRKVVTRGGKSWRCR
jgi:hypothetical protein